MRDDLRPYWLKRVYLRYRQWYVDYFLRPECASLGDHCTFMKPRYCIISGPNIHIGDCFTAVCEPMHRVEIGVWGREAGAGSIHIGRGVLMSPGSRISASDEITIGGMVAVWKFRPREQTVDTKGVAAGHMTAVIPLLRRFTRR